MSTSACGTCGKSKSQLSCGHCEISLCKNCAHFLPEDHFFYLPKKSPELSHSTYCGSCYFEHVEPAISEHEDLKEKAKQILVFMSNQGKETRYIKRIEKPVHVSNCTDRSQCLLQLAFFAAKSGHNAIVDVKITGEKVRNHAYQTTLWSGTAVPANVKQNQLMKDRALWENPN